MDHAYRTFAKGWSPDTDAINADPSTLLRADNVTLDELGALTLRRGMTCINPGEPLNDVNINSLFTVIIDAVKVRYAGSGNNVYRNAVTPLGPTFDGTGDVAFGSHLGRVLMARGTAKYKHDGTEVTNWGIEMTGGAIAAIDPLDTDGRQFASFEEEEAAAHEVLEDDGDGATYGEGFDADPNGAIIASPNVETGRLVITRTFDTDQDFTVLDGGWVATDDDIISFYIYTSNPNVVQKVTLQIDVNGGEFTQDFYLKEWPGAGASGPDSTVSNPGQPGPVVDPPGEPPLV